MKTFICNNCGAQVRRPTAPLRCDACGQQRIGLFKLGAEASTASGPSVSGSSRILPPPPPPGTAPTSSVPPSATAPAANTEDPRPAKTSASAPAPISPAPSATPSPATPTVGNVWPPSRSKASPDQKPAAQAADDRAAAERAAAKQVADQRAAAEKAAIARAAAQRAEGERAKAQRAAKDKAAAEPSVADRAKAKHQADRRAAAEHEAAQRAEAQRFDAQRAAAERAAEKAAAERAAARRAAKASAVSQVDQTPAAKATAPSAPRADEPGSVMWRFPTYLPGQGEPPRALRNCAIVNQQCHILAAIGTKLFALVEQNGNLETLWKYSLGGYVPGSPAMGADGRIRIHSSDGLLHCVSESGEQVWAPVSVGEPLGWASPVVDAESNTWICCYTGGLIKVDSRGSRTSTPYFYSRQKFDCTGVIHDHVLYVGAEDAFIYAIELQGNKGKNLWEPAEGRGKTQWFINSAPALATDLSLVVAGRDEYLYAFSLDGSQLWKLHIRGQILASPVIDAKGNIYVGVSLLKLGERGQGKLVCVDGQSHRVRWEYKAAGPVESTPVIGSDGIVYFGDNAGTIHAVRSDGQAAWSQNVNSAVRSSGTLAGPKRLLFGLDDGCLVALVCSSNDLSGGWPKYMGTLTQSGCLPI